ncbi:MAG: CerR family C-terminal domain-containing protein [Pirellulaceae bacterium]|nr:CerR family C-terminal domain-containing protein [Pirellulaceae bacterium]
MLNQAGPVFARSGFDRATIREICGAANVNVASVAYYFGDKMGLYRSVVAQIRDTRERRFPSPPNLGDVEPEVALVRLIHTMLSRMLKSDPSGWETQLLMREMDHPTVVFQELVNDFFRPVFDQLKSTIVRLIGRGAVDSDFDANAIDESVVEQFALSVVGQCLYYRLGRGVIDVLIPRGRQQESFDIDSLCQHIAAVTLSAAHNASFLHQKRELAPLIEQFKATVGSDVTAHRAESGNPLSSKPNIDK